MGPSIVFCFSYILYKCVFVWARVSLAYEKKRQKIIVFQAIYHKAKALHLQNLIRMNERVKKFMKQILALAYLPDDMIQRQFCKMWDDLSEVHQRQLGEFKMYYSRYWLQTVTPRGFSVYGLGQRTNNIIESYHSRLKHRMENQPEPWDFLCKYQF